MRVCGGVLHSAKYPRKPRPRLGGQRPEYHWRFSYCCAVDGCRLRSTPPSLRFLGRKVYLAAIVVVVCVMQHGISEPRMRRLNGVIGVDRRTLVRWRIWWREAFTASPFWSSARAAFMPPVDEHRLPAVLLERFAGQRSRAAHCAAALSYAHQRRTSAGSITAFANPQKTPVADCGQAL